LHIIDGSTGKLTPARLGLYDAEGHFQYPNDNAVPINVFYQTLRMYNCRTDHAWPAKNTYAFYTYGRYECELAAGKYELVARKGLEYRMAHEWLTIEPGRTLKHTVTLNKWRDMSAEGWYSGDTHVHIGRTRQQNKDVMAQIKAEDLNVANCSQMGNLETYYFKQYAWGEEGKYREGDNILVSSQEDPRTLLRAHTIFVNLKSMVRDEDTYYLYHKVFEEVKKQGGLVGFAHGGRSNSMALEVPFGLVDFVEILQLKCKPEVLYQFLDLGYRMVPSCASDFPYSNPPGTARCYVHIDGEFSAQAWFDNFAAGRSFITNGPMVSFTVNGKEAGSELKLNKGDQITIEATASINPDIDSLSELRLIAHSETIKAVQAKPGSRELRLTHTMTAENSAWLAVRVTCKKFADAHTAPIYVVVDGKPTWDRSKVKKLVAKHQKEMAGLLDKPVPEDRGEIWIYQTAAKEWARQRKLLEPRVKEATLKYEQLLRMRDSQ